ncbi:MAG: ANTAR domain-containing protein [Clostridia bacterium]|nr:ANTAR domain-containing protein [Clostridia bacterium]
MSSARERLRKSEKKALSIEEIRIVNRAKWLLISELKMDEQGAHRYIEKQAMDRCISKHFNHETNGFRHWLCRLVQNLTFFFFFYYFLKLNTKNHPRPTLLSESRIS